MADPALVVQIDRGVARLTLNRPDYANALTAEVAAELARAVDELAGNADVRVLIVTGTGKMFSAGGDIRAFVQTLETLDTLIGDALLTFNATLLALAALPFPVITALNGAVAGGGIGLALTADIVIGVPAVRFRAGYAAIGLSPDAGTSYFLTRLIGPQRAKEFLFTNRFIDAPEALALGLMTKIVPEAELLETAEELARSLAAMPRGGLAAVKSLVNAAAFESHAGMLARERDWMIDNAASADAREGIRAFMERRSPAFAR